MKRFSMWVGVVALLVPAAGHADFYEWTTESGTLSYTDEIERVPKRYREQAKLRPGQSIFDYERTTISLRAAPSPAQAPAVESPEAVTEALATAPGAITLEVGPGVLLDVAETGEPIHVTRFEFRWADGFYAPHTVVRRGGEEIAVVRER